MPTVPSLINVFEHDIGILDNSKPGLAKTRFALVLHSFRRSTYSNLLVPANHADSLITISSCGNVILSIVSSVYRGLH